MLVWIDVCKAYKIDYFFLFIEKYLVWWTQKSDCRACIALKRVRFLDCDIATTAVLQLNDVNPDY